MDTYKVRMFPLGSITKFPDSQTLFGSICWAIRDLYDEKTLEELLDNFFEHPHRFVVSSVFPEGLIKAPMEKWVKSEDLNQYYSDAKVDTVMVSERLKTLKKIQYVTLNLFKELLKGNVDKGELLINIILRESKGRYKLIDDKILALATDDGQTVKMVKEKGKRNSLNRLSGSTMMGDLYYYDRVFLDSEASLYFYIKTNDIDFFKPVFRLLSDSAIGRDKSIGVNCYRFSPGEKIVMEKKVKENYLISKYIPYFDEVDWDKSKYRIQFGSYKVESRFEFTGEDIIKREVGYLLEGSKIVLKKEKDIYGQLPIVKELKGKKIRQNGLAFFF